MDFKKVMKLSEITKIFGARLNSARKAKGVTYRELAENLGVSTNAVENYLRGAREPSFDKLVKMADLFEISIDELLGRNITPSLRLEQEQNRQLLTQINLLINKAKIFPERSDALCK